MFYRASTGLFLLVLFEITATAQTKAPEWDSKTAFHAAQVFGRLVPLNPTALQLEKLASKAGLAQRANDEYQKALQGLYDRERSRADDFYKYAVSGLRYTQQQLARLEEWKAKLEQIEAQRQATIEEVVRGAVSLLTKEQYDSIAIRPEDRQEAIEFMNRIRSVPEPEWPRFSQMAAMEFMRSEMRMLRGTVEGLLEGEQGGRGRGRDQFRGMFEAARNRAMERLEYYRKLPDNRVGAAIDQLVRERLGEEWMRQRVEGFLRDILTLEGAQQALLSLQKAKAGAPK